jgi:hypothetical protein
MPLPISACDVRAIAVCALVVCVACAGGPWVGPAGDEPEPSVVITLTHATHPGSWPTARAELGEQRVAFCPARITTSKWSDELTCDYLVGPLWVPADFRIVLRGTRTRRASIAPRTRSVWMPTGPTRTSPIGWTSGKATTWLTRRSLRTSLRVICDARRTTVLTPIVRATPEGLRISVESSEDVTELSFHRIAWEHGTSIGGPVGDGSVPIEPGPALVAYRDRGPRIGTWSSARSSSLTRRTMADERRGLR